MNCASCSMSWQTRSLLRGRFIAWVISPITAREFELLEQSAAFSEDDKYWLSVAGEILEDQTKQLVAKWREVIAALPHLARYAQKPGGEKDEHYSERSGLRFQQWVLDTC